MNNNVPIHEKRLTFVDFSKDEVDFVKLSLSKQQRFEMYMAALLAPLHPAVKNREAEKSQGSPLTWLNGLIGRLFFDFLVEDVWAQLVSEKIQKKLNRIKVSPFSVPLPFFPVLENLKKKIVNTSKLKSFLWFRKRNDPCVAFEMSPSVVKAL